MDRIGIKLENWAVTAFRMLSDRNRLIAVLAVLLAAVFSGIFLLPWPGSTGQRVQAVPSVGRSSQMANSFAAPEPAVLNPDLFYQDRGVRTGDPAPKTVPYRLTGTGRVKGVFRATIEDGKGNYFYAREGDRVGVYTVGKIRDRDVELKDGSGNVFVLKLGMR